MDDDEEGPLQCMLHMSGDTEHNGDAVIHLLNRYGKMLAYSSSKKTASGKIKVSCYY